MRGQGVRLRRMREVADPAPEWVGGGESGPLLKGANRTHTSPIRGLASIPTLSSPAGRSWLLCRGQGAPPSSICPVAVPTWPGTPEACGSQKRHSVA